LIIKYNPLRDSTTHAHILPLPTSHTHTHIFCRAIACGKHTKFIAQSTQKDTLLSCVDSREEARRCKSTMVQPTSAEILQTVHSFAPE
jgi:hypothetical protein